MVADGVHTHRLAQLLASFEEQLTPAEQAQLHRLTALRRPGDALVLLTWLVVEKNLVISWLAMSEINSLALDLADPGEFPYGLEHHVERPARNPLPRPAVFCPPQRVSVPAT